MMFERLQLYLCIDALWCHLQLQDRTINTSTTDLVGGSIRLLRKVALLVGHQVVALGKCQVLKIDSLAPCHCSCCNCLDPPPYSNHCIQG